MLLDKYTSTFFLMGIKRASKCRYSRLFSVTQGTTYQNCYTAYMSFICLHNQNKVIVKVSLLSNILKFKKVRKFYCVKGIFYFQKKASKLSFEIPIIQYFR